MGTYLYLKEVFDGLVKQNKTIENYSSVLIVCHKYQDQTEALLLGLVRKYTHPLLCLK
jgi:hypothetical protein